jgi:SAM-dependent methyltransferase
VRPTDLFREWEAMAPTWVTRMAIRGDDAREGLLDDWMLDLAGDVDGLDVIDLGCGEGRFCRALSARGARTLGVDLQPAMIEHAEAGRSPTERYLVADAQALDGVGGEGFDLAISYIALVDMPDQRAAVGEAFRVLRPGGRFLVCNLSPMATAWSTEGPWHRDGEGRKLHFVLDTYASEGSRTVTWPSGHRLTSFHRMLSTTVNDLLAAGFVLRGIHEPLPTQEQLDRAPANDDLFRVPIYVIYELVKPTGT